MTKVIEEIGNRYGRLVVVERVENDQHGKARWLCHCNCGNECIVNGGTLRRGCTTSCGCFRKERMSRVRTNDLTGKTFGRLTVLSRADNKGLDAAWLCACECGSKTIVRGHDLSGGKTKSCGCLMIEILSLPTGEAAFNSLFKNQKLGAKRRNLEWRLTKKDVLSLTQQPCFYCGVEPSQVVSSVSGTGDFVYNGLDRLDNDLGYFIGNVVPCCKDCNYAKRARSIGEFKSWAIRLYEHFASQPIEAVGFPSLEETP